MLKMRLMEIFYMIVLSLHVSEWCAGLGVNKSMAIIRGKNNFNTSNRLCSSIGGKLAGRSLIDKHRWCIETHLVERNIRKIKFWIGNDTECMEPGIDFCTVKIRIEKGMIKMQNPRPDRSTKNHSSLCEVDLSIYQEVNDTFHLCSRTSTRMTTSSSAVYLLKTSQPITENSTTGSISLQTTEVMSVGVPDQSTKHMVESTHGNIAVTIAVVVFLLVLVICVLLMIIVYKRRSKKRRSKKETNIRQYWTKEKSMTASLTDVSPKLIKEESTYSEINENEGKENRNNERKQLTVNPVSNNTNVAYDHLDRGRHECRNDNKVEVYGSLCNKESDDILGHQDKGQTDGNYDHLERSRKTSNNIITSEYSMVDDRTYTDLKRRQHIVHSDTDYDHCDFQQLPQ